MRTRVETGTRIALCMLTALLLAAEPALAELDLDANLGIRTGSTTQEIAGQFETTSFHVGPILDLRWHDFGLGFAFLYAEHKSDASFSLALPEIISQLGGPSSIHIPAEGRDSARYDFDVSLKYEVNKYVTPFIGYRKEKMANLGFSIDTSDPRFQADVAQIQGVIQAAVEGQILTPEEAQALLGALSVNEAFFDLDIDFFVFGASLSYPIGDIGLVPFFVGTGFAWAQVQDQEATFPGYALEGGLAYALGSHWDVPLYVTASVKYQFLETGKPLAELEEFWPGASEVLPVKEEVLNSNFGIFYRFGF